MVSRIGKLGVECTSQDCQKMAFVLPDRTNELFGLANENASVNEIELRTLPAGIYLN
jgi:hypothetical protein